MKKRLVLTFFVFLMMFTFPGCFNETKESPTPTGQNTDSPTNEVDWEGTVTVDGTTYRRRTDLKTVLFLGVDNSDTYEFKDDLIGNNGRSDAIMLFLMDTKTGTTDLLTISRDTITEVDVYDGKGELQFSNPMQITLQYSFGNSPKRSCFLTQRTVSELLYGARIDGYFSLTMDGIPVIVDELGGITVTLPEDYSYIDSGYTMGATITLDGTQAERFVRYRDINEFGSNEQRNERQSWFVTELFSQIRNMDDVDGMVDHLLEIADKYIETNLDAETMMRFLHSTLSQTYKVPGEVRAGEFHNEYYVDEDGLRDLVLQLFYRPVEE